MNRSTLLLVGGGLAAAAVGLWWWSSRGAAKEAMQSEAITTATDTSSAQAPFTIAPEQAVRAAAGETFIAKFRGLAGVSVG